MIFWAPLEEGEGAAKKVYKLPAGSFNKVLPITFGSIVIGIYIIFQAGVSVIGMFGAACIIWGIKFGLSPLQNKKDIERKDKMHAERLRTLISTLEKSDDEDWIFDVEFESDNSVQDNISSWKVWHSELLDQVVFVHYPNSTSPKTEGMIWEIDLYDSPDDIKLIHKSIEKNKKVPCTLILGKDEFDCVFSNNSLDSLKNLLSKSWLKDLENDDNSIRTKALGALSNLANQKILDNLIKDIKLKKISPISKPWLDDLNSDNSSNQAAALIVLANLGYEEAGNKIIPLLELVDTEIKASAAQVIGEIRYVKAIESLITMLRDNDYRVRMEADDALIKITSQDFDRDPQKWMSWWQEHKDEYK